MSRAKPFSSRSPRFTRARAAMRRIGSATTRAFATRKAKVAGAVLAGVAAGALSMHKLPSDSRAVKKRGIETRAALVERRLAGDRTLTRNLRPSTLREAQRDAGNSLLHLDALVDYKQLNRRAAEAERARLEREGQFVEEGPEGLIDVLSTLPEAEVQRRLDKLYRVTPSNPGARNSPLYQSNLTQVREARAELQDYLLARAQRVRERVERTHSASQKKELTKLYRRYVERAILVGGSTTGFLLLVAALASTRRRPRG